MVIISQIIDGMSNPLVVSLALLLFVLVAVGYTAMHFYTLYKKSQKPITNLKMNKELITKLSKIIKQLSFEDKLIVLKLMLGDCDFFCRVDSSGVSINSVGRLPIQPPEDEEAPAGVG